jgi:hypothetical protein
VATMAWLNESLKFRLLRLLPSVSSWAILRITPLQIIWTLHGRDEIPSPRL